MYRHTVKQIIKSLNSIKGFTLIEVLVAMIVLAVGLLGLASLQAVGLKNSHSSYYRSQATMLAYEIVDQMRANRDKALNASGGEYNIALGQTPTTGGSIPKQDLVAWFNRLASILPSGAGAINCVPSTSICTITVRWNDSQGSSGSSSQQFTMTTQL